MNRKRHNILIIDNSTYITGALRSITTFTKLLDGEVNYYFIVPNSSATSQFLDINNIRYENINFLEISKKLKVVLYPIYLIINSLRILKIIKKRKIHIIHINDIYNLTGIVLKIIRPNLKLVYHVRLLPNSYLKILYSSLIKIIGHYSDAIICVSTAVFNSVPTKYSQKKIIFDTIEDICTDRPSREFIKAESILYVGNFLSGKGQINALYTLSELIDIYPNLKMKFFGRKIDKSYSNRFDQLSKQLNLTNNIEVIENETNLDVIYKNFDIFLNLSESESFSLTTLEASYYELPIVCFNSGGPSDIIENNVSGHLIERFRKQSPSGFIKDLLINFELQKKFAINAKRTVISKFRPALLSSKLLKLYESLS